MELKWFNLHIIPPNYMWDAIKDMFVDLMYWMISNRYLN